jgi:hypothetical protein
MFPSSPYALFASPYRQDETTNNTDNNNEHAYAGQLNTFTHLRALFGTP